MGKVDEMRSLRASDGSPIEVGRSYWGLSDGRRWLVVGVDPWREAHPVLARSDDDQHTFRDLRPGWLTSEEPDTLNGICRDALDTYTDYWECGSTSCDKCPRVDEVGRTPAQRHCVDSCQEAQKIDCIVRAYRLGRREEARAKRG